jgi:outer membrane protein OmpA-like peptidoglycan-associated protein
MKFAIIALAAVMAATVSIAGTSSPPSSDINLAAFANGALIESVSSNYGSGWEARWITDGNPQTGWATEKGAKGPFEIVISLPERSEFHALEFDVAGTESPERSAKDIDILVSDTSATAGFAPLSSVALKPGEDHQRFAIAKPGAGRWLKLILKSNHGDPDYTELMEFRAFGRQLTQTPMPTDLSGTYISSAYGAFHLQQNGAALSGCYEHNTGLVDGGAESHLMRLTWHENGQPGSGGPAIMVLKRDGKSFEGWWADEGSNSWSPNWDLKKTSNVVGSCPNWNPKGTSGNIVATELAQSGHARLYGINFDTDSDHLRADAKPAIDQLLAALKAHPDWKVSIEGHTDSTGNAAHNLDLSKRRAASVMAALTADGIDAGRMTSQGFGQTKPIASNDNEIGRAQNRRVEVVRP